MLGYVKLKETLYIMLFIGRMVPLGYWDQTYTIKKFQRPQNKGLKSSFDFCWSKSHNLHQPKTILWECQSCLAK